MGESQAQNNALFALMPATIEARSFVLHVYPYLETSLLAQAFSRDHGLVMLVVRGGRRPRSALRGHLLAFHPLALSWYGKGEVKNLRRAEWLGGHTRLKNRGLMLGFYLNELLLKTLPREDPHPQLFEVYENTLTALAQNLSDVEPCLRRFELALLQELGYGPTLNREADGGRPLDPQGRYLYRQEKGLERVDQVSEMLETEVLHGHAILQMAAGDFSDDRTQMQAKLLARKILNHHLHGQLLHSRRVYRDLQHSSVMASKNS